MPGMDKSGPLGTGPVGRGLGPCGGGTANRGRGRGFGRGGGAGWGMMPPASTEEEEKIQLNQQKSWLQRQLEAITTRLEGLGKEE